MPVLEWRSMESLHMKKIKSSIRCIGFDVDSHVKNWVNLSINVGFYSLIDGFLELGLRVRCTNGKSELCPIRI